MIDSFGGAHERRHLDRHDQFYIDCPAKNVLTAIALVADSCSGSPSSRPSSSAS